MRVCVALAHAPTSMSTDFTLAAMFPPLVSGGVRALNACLTIVCWTHVPAIWWAMSYHRNIQHHGCAVLCNGARDRSRLRLLFPCPALRVSVSCSWCVECLGCVTELECRLVLFHCPLILLEPHLLSQLCSHVSRIVLCFFALCACDRG